jgi:hypothetical protein
MSDDVEGLRREIGEKMALDKEPLHANASESVKKGYRAKMLGFGSNTTPRNFGKGGSKPQSWICVCGHENSGSVRKKVGGRVVCWQCGLEQGIAEKANS